MKETAEIGNVSISVLFNCINEDKNLPSALN